MKSLSRYSPVFLYTSVLPLLLGSNLLLAQDAGDDGYEVVLEEVIVTAQKREQRAQDISASISVVSDELMQRRQWRGLDDFNQAVPNLYIEESLGQNSTSAVFLRSFLMRQWRFIRTVFTTRGMPVH